MIQEAALKAAGYALIQAEKKSGSNKQERNELNTLLEFMRDGDSVGTRVVRLACSVGDPQYIVRLLKHKGVTLEATGHPIETSSAAGKAFLDMLGLFAESHRWMASRQQKAEVSTKEESSRRCRLKPPS